MMDTAIQSAGPKVGEVFTFYSYKGGTGRSMLLANVAWLLASAGKKVLLIDWDLEAPGLHRYFRPFLGDDPELKNQEGVIDWLTDYWDAYLDEPEAAVEALVSDFADPRHYVRRLETGSYLAGGIDLLCAGRQDATYAAAVADFDFTTLYRKLRGEKFIAVAKSILVGPEGYDYVLIDSRTGVSDTSGFCTVSLADTLVVCFTYNNQSVIGASQIARDIKTQAQERRRQQSLDPLRLASGEALPEPPHRFRLFAVPCRVDDLDPDRLEQRQRIAWAQFEDLLTDVPKDELSAYWLNVQIHNHGLFAYEEVLAACMNRPAERRSVLGSVIELTSRLTDKRIVDPPSLSDEQRKALRESFADVSRSVLPLRTFTAWSIFVERQSAAEERAALLEACFPLLVQLFTVAPAASADTGAPNLVRTIVYESDLTGEERRIAETLLGLGVAQRRVTDDHQRGLMIADDSILQNWSELRARLEQSTTFLAMRDQVRQARRSWEAGGRSITALRSLTGGWIQFQLSDGEQAWMGRPNLQLLHSVQEVRALETAESEGKARLAAAAVEFRDRVQALETSFGGREEEWRGRLAKAEQDAAHNAQLLQTRADEARVLLEKSELQRALGEADLRKQQEAAEQAEKASAARDSEQQALIARAERRVSAVAFITAALIVGLGGLAAYGTDGLRAELRQAQARVAQADAALSESERQRVAAEAMRFYGEGMRLLAESPKAADVQAAIEAFGKAIQLDPKFGEAYRSRAAARKRLDPKARDESAIRADMATYLELRPSLSRRGSFILETALDGPVDDQFMLGQLNALLADALSTNARDTSPALLASTIEKFQHNFSPAVMQAIPRTVTTLRAAQQTIPNSDAAAKK